MSQHSLDEKLAEAAEYELGNAAQLPDAEFSQALLESPFLPELAKRFGSEYIPRIEKDFKLKKAGLELLAEEEKFMALYQQKRAALRISFRGKTYSKGEMDPFLESPDRETRKEAKKAILTAFHEQRDEFISFLQKTVKTRDALAKANGFSDFASYMNVSYDRTGYGGASGVGRNSRSGIETSTDGRVTFGTRAADKPQFELRLLGMRYEEAEKAHERQLDLCVIHNFKEFSVIHGKGNGVLQQMVHEHLKQLDAVKEFHFAKPEDGGSGKTYVTLF